MENVRQKVIGTERKRNYLMPEPIYRTTMFFHSKYIRNRNEKNSNIHD